MKQRTCETCKRIGWIAAFVALSAFLLFCALSAAEDQRRIDAMPDAKARVYDFQFFERQEYYLEQQIRWKRGQTITWTIYDNMAGDDGCAIGKGEGE